MKLILLLVLVVTSSMPVFSQTKYQGKSSGMIIFEANPGFNPVAFETSSLNIKLQVEQNDLEFNADITSFKNSNPKDTIQLFQLLPADRNSVLNFNGDLPTLVAFGNSSADQNFSLRGQMELNTELQSQTLNLRIMTRDDEVAYSFTLNQDVKNFNIILPEKFTKQLTGRFRMTSTGGLLVLQY